MNNKKNAIITNSKTKIIIGDEYINDGIYDNDIKDMQERYNKNMENLLSMDMLIRESIDNRKREHYAILEKTMLKDSRKPIKTIKKIKKVVEQDNQQEDNIINKLRKDLNKINTLNININQYKNDRKNRKRLVRRSTNSGEIKNDRKYILLKDFQVKNTKVKNTNDNNNNIDEENEYILLKDSQEEKKQIISPPPPPTNIINITNTIMKNENYNSNYSLVDKIRKKIKSSIINDSIKNNNELISNSQELIEKLNNIDKYIK
jgi:hypothetical protein